MLIKRVFFVKKRPNMSSVIIANPLYDVVFKYLLEDIDIARELLSTILEEDIIHIEVKPQETMVETSASSISILRFDFKSIIKTKTGDLKKVLIELQKVKQMLDVMRFRRYLGDNYRKEDDVFNEHGEQEKRPLPIVTIYFLGFPLNQLKNATIKINREYKDAATHEPISIKEDFIELLTHDSFVIQTKQLVGKTKTKLERVLQVFSPEYQTSDKHQLEFRGDLNEPLVKKMVDRLGRAIANEDIREKMDVEDEIDRIFERELKKLAEEKDKIIAEKDLELADKDQQLILERQKAEEERQKAEEEKLKNIELQKQIEVLMKQLKK
jgi:hypothetical protein